MFAAIQLFNYNYDVEGNKAKQRYIPLFGDGATASSGDLPSGFAVGCLDCYAYAGIKLKFRQDHSAGIEMFLSQMRSKCSFFVTDYSSNTRIAISDPFCNRATVYAGTPLLAFPYLQIQAEGLLTGKFTLHAQTPSVQAGATSKASRMIYPGVGGALKLVDAGASFTDVLKTFDGSIKFDKSAAVTPNLPSDWTGPPPITITVGVPVTIQVHLALVAEVSATRDNQFKASVGAFAKATSSVGLFIFSKINKPCTDVKFSGGTVWLPKDSYKEICLDVLKDASVTEAQIQSCTVPSGVQGLSGSCSANEWLVLQKRTGPIVETGFSAPTLTAANKANVVFGVGFYPMYAELRVLFFASILTTVP